MGAALIILGFYLRYRVGKTRYNRRYRPIEKVPSYNLSLWRRLRDEGLVFVCYLLIVIRILLILAYYGGKH
jgi:hypothetical protein